MSMESHLDKRKEATDTFRETNETVIYLMENYLSHLPSDVLPIANSEVLHKICGILDVNGLEISFGGAEMIALYPTACMIEHSCIPNTKHNFLINDFKIKLQTAIDVKKGDHVSTMYTHALWGTMARRAHLKETKYFECICSRCIDPTELGTNFSTLNCVGESLKGDRCSGQILPVDPLNESSEWKCTLCPFLLSSEHIADLISRISIEVEEVLQTPKVSKLESLVDKMEKILDKNHYQIFMLKHTLIQLYGREIPHKDLTENLLDRKIEMINDMLDVISRLDPGNSRLSLYTSVLHYELHSAILEISNRRSCIEEKKEFWEKAKAELATTANILEQETCNSASTALLSIVKINLEKMQGIIDRNGET